MTTNLPLSFALRIVALAGTAAPIHAQQVNAVAIGLGARRSELAGIGGRGCDWLYVDTIGSSAVSWLRARSTGASDAINLQW